MRYFLRLSYNGASFHGWQYQPNAVSVQQELEDALSKLMGTKTVLTGAGRTDAGVHAREMYAHFDTNRAIADKGKILFSLNRMMGRDIAVQDIIPVADNAHARFDAVERTYRYFVAYDDNPFMHPFSWHSPSILDADAMNEAASWLTEVSDFTSFAKLHSDAKTNICDVRYAHWDAADDTSGGFFLPGIAPGLVFTVTADRFLRNMVRAMVGTLVEIGRGKMDFAAFRQIVESRDRCAAGTSMPANGLFLWEVKYPASSFACET